MATMNLLEIIDRFSGSAFFLKKLFILSRIFICTGTDFDHAYEGVVAQPFLPRRNDASFSIFVKETFPEYRPDQIKITCKLHIICHSMAMKKWTIADLPRQQIEELLYRALRAIYLFERIEIDRFDLNYQQMYLLKFLKRKSPFRISDIAGELRVPAFSATRLIKELESKKLLLRSRDLKDRRNVFIRLSPAGEEIVRRIEADIVSTIISTLGTYGEVELRVLIDMVKNLDVILGVAPPLD